MTMTKRFGKTKDLWKPGDYAYQYTLLANRHDMLEIVNKPCYWGGIFVRRMSDDHVYATYPTHLNEPSVDELIEALRINQDVAEEILLFQLQRHAKILGVTL